MCLNFSHLPLPQGLNHVFSDQLRYLHLGLPASREFPMEQHPRKHKKMERRSGSQRVGVAESVARRSYSLSSARRVQPGRNNNASKNNRPQRQHLHRWCLASQHLYWIYVRYLWSQQQHPLHQAKWRQGPQQLHSHHRRSRPAYTGKSASLENYQTLDQDTDLLPRWVCFN